MASAKRFTIRSKYLQEKPAANVSINAIGNMLVTQFDLWRPVGGTSFGFACARGFTATRSSDIKFEALAGITDDGSIEKTILERP